MPGRGRTQGDDVGAGDGSLAATKAKYQPSVTGLGDVYREPFARPLATLAASVVVVALAYQAAALGATNPVAGVVVGVAGVAAYALARVAWRVENEYVATELARMDLDPDRRDPSVPGADAGPDRPAD